MPKSSEIVLNCRHLSGAAPLWMLYQAVRLSPSWTVRLVVSREETARLAIEALQGAGVRVDLDPIGAEFHLMCRGASGAAEAVLAWLTTGADSTKVT